MESILVFFSILIGKTLFAWQEKLLKVVFNIDMDSDIAVAAAFNGLHPFENQGKIDYLATTSCSAFPALHELFDISYKHYN